MAQTKDQDGVVKDGEVVKVPMIVMDHRPAITDHHTLDYYFAMAGHRPGSLRVSDAERQQRIERQRQSDARLSQRWRDLSPTADVTDAPGPAVTSRERYQARIANAWRAR